MVAGEAAWGDFALARYNPDGSLDTTFDDDGLVTTDLSGYTDIGHAIAQQPDGKIIIAGSVINNSQYFFAVARFKSGLEMSP